MQHTTEEDWKIKNNKDEDNNGIVANELIWNQAVPNFKECIGPNFLFQAVKRKNCSNRDYI